MEGGEQWGWVGVFARQDQAREEAANVTAPNCGPCGLSTRRHRRAGTSIVVGGQFAAGAFAALRVAAGTGARRGAVRNDGLSGLRTRADSGKGCPEGLPFGAGLGRREAQRRGLGMARIPNSRMAARLNCVSGSAARCLRSSIFVRHHHGDGGLRVVNVERAASGNQFDEARLAVVVADVERERLG